jgi:hypothetical protein
VSAFDPQDLLGRAENDHLEFKEAEALRRPANIAREVVGFLNADGGDIWIGIKEEAGRAVELQTIPDVEGARRSLLDHLVDIIEPQFIPAEVELACKGGLLCVSVQKGHNPPYAQRDGGRRFMVRIADRLREMSREEIAMAFGDGSKKEDRLAATKDSLRKDQTSVIPGRPQLWLRLVPTDPLAIDFNDRPTKQQFETWLKDAKSTGNRPSGSTFVNRLAWPDFSTKQVVLGGDKEYRRTQITEDGQVTFTVDGIGLSRLDIPSPQLDPYALMEYPVSVFRLMSEILKRYDKGDTKRQVIARLVISGIRGFSLRPGSPRGDSIWALEGRANFEKDVLEIDPERLVFDARELKENPDRCGLRVVLRIYGEFGFDNDAIPREFDQKQGVLVLE